MTTPRFLGILFVIFAQKSRASQIDAQFCRQGFYKPSKGNYSFPVRLVLKSHVLSFRPNNYFKKCQRFSYIFYHGLWLANRMWISVLD